MPGRPGSYPSRNGLGQLVRADGKPARSGDRYADVFVDTAQSRAVYGEWKRLTKPAQGPLRRPLWMNRSLRPADEAYRF